MTTESVYHYLKGLVADYERRGLDAMPETFPKQFKTGHYGSWLRLPPGSSHGPRSETGCLLYVKQGHLPPALP